MEKTMEKIVAVANQEDLYMRLEIYGGLANTWTTVNLGVRIEKQRKKTWWKKIHSGKSIERRC